MALPSLTLLLLLLLLLPLDPIPWPEGQDARISVNSFGIGGSNAHVRRATMVQNGLLDCLILRPGRSRLGCLLSPKAANEAQPSRGRFEWRLSSGRSRQINRPMQPTAPTELAGASATVSPSFRFELKENLPIAPKHPAVSIVIIGHEKSGKSTTTGHLLFKCGGIDQRTIEKLEKEGASTYAAVMDKLNAERESGIRENFRWETSKHVVTLIDSGDLSKHDTSGPAQADCGILLVSAVQDEFLPGLSKNGQARKDAKLAFDLGVRQLIVAINKMDPVKWSENGFVEAQKEANDFVRKIRYNSHAVAFIPMSGLHGDNLIEATSSCPWYKGWSKEERNGKTIVGKTLLDAIDTIEPSLGAGK
ncbi:hypothetical protein HIM_11284 [Hirsutella minnesotensis 3608]|uniref:Tr-type G domain-containing protein n=1 Tax=Hirsutella minnesotensis 3608 TaxID=1043627 RepID=A0A0F7ZFL0_9HYPO|nr:hypothetical protein HIM_11284 [Hirsutella minnesotensis 3608]